MLLPPPPYSLDTPAFRFRALAALAGRAALGGERETALAALVSARLAAAALPPDALPLALREARAQAARAWLASIALGAGVRAVFLRVVEASGGDDCAAMADALGRIREAAARQLDAPSLGEIASLERALREG